VSGLSRDEQIDCIKWGRVMRDWLLGDDPLLFRVLYRKYALAAVFRGELPSEPSGRPAGRNPEAAATRQHPAQPAPA